MKPASAQDLTNNDRAQNESGFFSSESVLGILKLILAGSELSEVLTIIARLVESQGNGMLCTIWLPHADGKHLYCAAAPSLPGFAESSGLTLIGPGSASCGTAVYRREPFYVADIRTEPAWDDYRDRIRSYGIRAVWSRPLFTRESTVLGTFAVLYRQVRNPDAHDLQLIENAGHIAGIAIERHIHEEALRHERDRLRLLLELTNSTISKLDLPRLIEALSTKLLSVTRCDFCALLLPDTDSGDLRVTTLYNPEARGFVNDGTIIPVHGSLCGKAFRTGRTQHFDRLEELRDDPESFGNSTGRRFYQLLGAEGLVSGCDLPLICRNGVVGVLSALKRSEKAFEKPDVVFLEQVARQAAIAVENALEYQKANLNKRPDGTICQPAAGTIAIDPELGRIQYGLGVAIPTQLLVNYSYGSSAEMGGGPYDRTTLISPTASPQFSATVGSAEFATLAQAVAAWNAQPAGATGVIMLPNYASYVIDLTGAGAIQIPSESLLLIASAFVPATAGAAPLSKNSCVTLSGTIAVNGLPGPVLQHGVAAPPGQLQISGINLIGSVQLTGSASCLMVLDSTLMPGSAPCITGSVIGAGVCLTRVITGPVTLPPSCSVRATASIIDAGSPDGVAYSGDDLASPGATLHIENCTVIGKVWAEAMRLASDTMFFARLAPADTWKAPVQARRLQVGCVRFCSLPWSSITPRRYECLPPNAASESALLPSFVTLSFGRPGYCLLSGYAPLAVWKGASNGSQIGVYLGIQKTEAVTNVGIRSAEYLPANLERGVFLIPSRPE